MARAPPCGTEIPQCSGLLLYRDVLSFSGARYRKSQQRDSTHLPTVCGQAEEAGGSTTRQTV